MSTQTSEFGMTYGTTDTEISEWRSIFDKDFSVAENTIKGSNAVTSTCGIFSLGCGMCGSDC
jgi:hypothetical protein